MTLIWPSSFWSLVLSLTIRVNLGRCCNILSVTAQLISRYDSGRCAISRTGRHSGCVARYCHFTSLSKRYKWQSMNVWYFEEALSEYDKQDRISGNRWMYGTLKTHWVNMTYFLWYMYIQQCFNLMWNIQECLNLMWFIPECLNLMWYIQECFKVIWSQHAPLHNSPVPPPPPPPAYLSSNSVGTATVDCEPSSVTRTTEVCFSFCWFLSNGFAIWIIEYF
jgi:hypothetical protein